MSDNNFMTPEEMKKELGLKTTTDNRTLNKYVVQGKLEVKPLSRKIKLYRFANDNYLTQNLNDEEWNFA